MLIHYHLLINLQESGLPCWVTWYISISSVTFTQLMVCPARIFMPWTHVSWCIFAAFENLMNAHPTVSASSYLKRTEAGRVTVDLLATSPKLKGPLAWPFQLHLSPFAFPALPCHPGQTQIPDCGTSWAWHKHKGNIKTSLDLCQMVHWGCTIGEWILLHAPPVQHGRDECSV